LRKIKRVTDSDRAPTSAEECDMEENISEQSSNHESHHSAPVSPHTSDIPSDSTDIPDVLRFLLPGLCHLTAEDKTRKLFLHHNGHDLLHRYLQHKWFCFHDLGQTDIEVSDLHILLQFMPLGNKLVL